MDPNATLDAAREAWHNGDYEEAAQLYRSLDLWVSNGGFWPTLWSNAKEA